MDRIVDDLWGEEVPESAQKMVQIFISQLRKQLPQGLIETRAPGYRFDLDGHSLDLRSFERLHADGREALAVAGPERRRRYSGERWSCGAARRSPSSRSRSHAWRNPGSLSSTSPASRSASMRSWILGRHAELVAELETLVRRHPLRERLRGQLMLALYRCGRHAEALEAFQTFRRMLNDELGIDPPPRLKEVERLILRQDVSLDHDSHERPPRWTRRVWGRHAPRRPQRNTAT